jgi:hypothetical protein
MNMHGQYKIDPAVQNNRCSLTGNLQYDLSRDINGDSSADSSDAARTVDSKRLYSPFRAGLFSAVIPGAGQFYTKTYWQSAAFFGAEVLLWVLYATYENKGDSETEIFQRSADENWSVVRYTGWINANFGQSISINPDQSLKPWERIHWGELNAVEDQIGGNMNIQPTGFTHKLAPHGDQQYYEMIGKYAQFGSGWDDASAFTKNDVLTENVTNNFLKYRDMRGKANSFYNIETTVSYIIVANHVFSALEAAWNASKLNHRIKLEGHIESRQIDGNIVEFVPPLHLEYEL